MVEYERLFSQAVQLKLKSIIKGKIFVCVTYGDELLVKIYHDGISYSKQQCRQLQQN